MKISAYPWLMEAEFDQYSKLCSSFTVDAAPVVLVYRATELLRLFASEGLDIFEHVFGKLDSLPSPPPADLFNFFLSDLRISDLGNGRIPAALSKIFDSEPLDSFGKPLNSGRVMLSIALSGALN
ncbi:MAG: hypothetical protein Q7T16_03665 [Candidatus Burarchaeum sp.]|nr:hypothetical protein [Candidatus Burarchaeum sp.]MDO8339729.1 hypothetical protein [Candidatus Burarchaeum sp.]